MPHLLARVENFPRFDGENLSAEPVMGYGKSGEVPHEMYNFNVASDGFIYGYLPREGGGDLERLGGKITDKEVTGVTVIFISSGFLCGYYLDATIFETPILHPDHLKAGDQDIYCRARVSPDNAFLIPPRNRKIKVEPRPRGQFPVLYGEDDSYWVRWFFEHISSIENSILSEQKRKRWSRSIERSSDARRLAIEKYGRKCECCKISHNDSVRGAIFEVHHKIPFSEDFDKRVLDYRDLSVLCANCHRMIHKMPDLADINELRRFIGIK
ncbi:HNH endonuclease [Cereibacter sphaeroides]|nr:HNH endonuclease [Cereibacter sphaeroides]